MDSIEITAGNPSTRNSETLPSAGSNSVNEELGADPSSFEGRSTNGSILTNQGTGIAREQRTKPRDSLPNGHLFHSGRHIVSISGVGPNEKCHFTFMTLPPENRSAAPEFFSKKVYKMREQDPCLDHECIVLSEITSCGASDCDFDTPQWCVYSRLTYPEYAKGYKYKDHVEKEAFAWPGDASAGRSCFNGILPYHVLDLKYVNSDKGPPV